LTLDFEPSLIEKHPHLLDCVRAVAYSHRNPLKTIAMDMDLSQSELSRKLSGNPDDPRRFTLDDLERFIGATGDVTPIHWLIGKYLEDENSKQQRAMQQLARQLPDVLALIRAATSAAAPQ
jgi:hypothetical protein